MESNKYVVRPFNRNYIILILSMFAFSLVIFLIFKDLTLEQQYRNFLILAILQIIIIVIYRIILFKDKEYCNAVYGSDDPNYYDEMPLNPCNIVTLLTPLAIIYRWRVVCAFCFFVGMIGPVFALIFPTRGFDKYSILKPRMILFYEYHWVCLMYPHLFMVSNIFEPKYIDCLGALGLCLLFGVFAYFINRYLIESRKDIYANFFFVYDPHFNPVLEYFYTKIPYRFFYAIPAYFLIYLIFNIVTYFLV